MKDCTGAGINESTINYLTWRPWLLSVGRFAISSNILGDIVLYTTLIPLLVCEHLPLRDIPFFSIFLGQSTSSENQYGVSFITEFVFCIVASDWFISFIVHQSFAPTSWTVKEGLGKQKNGGSRDIHFVDKITIKQYSLC